MRFFQLTIYTLFLGIINANYLLKATAQNVSITPQFIVPVIPADVINTNKQNPINSDFLGYIDTNNKSPLPSSNNNLFVLASNIKIITASAELQQIIRQNIRTKLGQNTSKQQLQDDIQSILNTGLFANVRVMTAASNVGIDITYEAEPIEVEKIVIADSKILKDNIINDIFQSQIGAKISPNSLNQGLEKLQQWYNQNGYVLAKVLSLQPKADGTVIINVTEGIINNVKVSFVDILGNPVNGRTKNDFILERVKTKNGEVFSTETAQKDLRKLYQLGLFEKAEIVLNQKEEKLEVTYKLRERKSRLITGGAGYNDDLGLYGLINYSDLNFNGVGQQFSNNILISTRDLQFDSKLTNPYRSSNPEQWGSSISIFRKRGYSQTFDDKILLGNGDRVREGKLGGGVKLLNSIEDWQTSLGLNYNRTSLRDKSGDIVTQDVQGNPLSFSGKGIDDLVTFSLGFTRDKRDNIINPSNGSVISFNSEQSLPVGLGEILMNKLQANYVQYFSMTEDQVLAFNLQGGTVIGDLPPYQSFNLGGINTVRGYGLADVASARSYILASTEYRFPLFSELGGVFFLDFGSDLGTSETVLGKPGIVRNKPGFGFGYGTGIRLESPLGVVRADFGINDQGERRLQFGFGQKF
jgi:outer membrane protein insertion porin family